MTDYLEVNLLKIIEDSLSTIINNAIDTAINNTSSSISTQSTINPGYREGFYYSYPGVDIIVDKTDSSKADRLYFNFIYLPTKKLKNLAFRVSGSSNSESEVKLGIYSMSEDGYPQNKVAENIVATISNSIYVSMFDIDLTEGWYAFAYLSKTNLKIRSIYDNYFSRKRSLYGMNGPIGGSLTGLMYEHDYSLGLPEIFNPQDYADNLLDCKSSPYIEFSF